MIRPTEDKPRPQGLDDPAFGGEADGVQNIPWNADDRPVRVTRPTASYSGGIPGPNVSVRTNVYAAQNYANQLRGMGGQDYSNFVSDLRRYTGSKLGTTGAVDAAWYQVLQDAASSGQDAWQLLTGGQSPDDQQGSGGGSGVRTMRSISMMAEPDIRALADQIGMEMMGRGVSDQELTRIVKRIRKAEVNNPTVQTGSAGMSTTKSGLTQQGRQDIITNILAKNPEYGDYQKASTLMGWFFDALNRRPDAAG